MKAVNLHQHLICHEEETSNIPSTIKAKSSVNPPTLVRDGIQAGNNRLSAKGPTYTCYLCFTAQSN